MRKQLKKKLRTVIFKTNTPAGKAFDIALLLAILTSVGVVILESVEAIAINYTNAFIYTEWTFTFLFTIEYILRIIISNKKRKYIFSFFGIIDFLSILPAYLSLVFTGMHTLVILRSFRLLRVFRIFKLARFMGEASQLRKALSSSRPKIIVFLVTVGIIVVIMGTIMYLVEGAENGFTSIPKSIYWAIVTLTTVGYGDVAPSTVLGQTIASVIMIMGYGIIAVPTGIVTAEMAKTWPGKAIKDRTCNKCHKSIYDEDAIFCKFCGTAMK